VFGTAEGSFAAFAAASADKLVHKPADLSFEQAAAIPTSGYAALQALRDQGEVQAGQRVLVIGASGGVGAYAVQIAKALGAAVTGVASTRSLDTVRALGADHVIDYTQGDITRSGERYDLVIDTAGHRSLSTLRRLLTTTGTAVIVGAEGGDRFVGGFDRQIRALMLSPFVSQRLRILTSADRGADLETLREWAETGKLTPTIERTYPLADTADAIRHVHEGRPRGKVVITI
jgi:NADPH:quinone reductase-like Zn-dependent oxidoreductase